MATYKVIQDIEAEDKILGPLTLRQFIFGLAAAFLLYICFLCVTKGLPFLLILFLPPALFTGFFAFPFGRDQPTEIWALAKIRFFFKPRRRIWDQSGMKELVTITVPKKIERVLTNGLSENEVKSRLNALANTIDSRGWAIKNVNVNMYTQPDPMTQSSSDRLIDVSSVPQEVPNYDIQASDDIMDETNNPIAQQFDSMITASAQTHRQQLVDQMNSTRVAAAPPQPTAAPNDYWFMNQPTAATKLPDDQAMFAGSQFVQPGASGSTSAASSNNTATEAALTAELKSHNNSQQISYSHLHTLQPLGAQPAGVPNEPAQAVSVDDTTTAVTPSPTTYDPAILSLANNNDLNVATLAREANKAKDHEKPSDDEVVISLR